MNREHGGSRGQEHLKAADVSINFQQRLHIFGGGDVFGNPAAKTKERFSQRFWWKLNEALTFYIQKIKYAVLRSSGYSYTLYILFHPKPKAVFGVLLKSQSATAALMLV